MKVTDDLVEASILAPIGAKILETDTQVIRRDDWYQLVTPSLKDNTLNEVVLSRIADSEAAHCVEETIESYRSHELPFKWCIGPMANTPAIEPLLQPQASQHWLYRGMATATTLPVSVPDRIRISRVDAENFEDFLNVFLTGWSLENYRRSARINYAVITHPNTSHPYYIASLDDVPVGVAGTVVKGNYGYLMGAVVLEKFRGVGAYRALLGARLQDLHSRGLTYAVTQAREATSAPILEKLGFATTFRARIYAFTAR